MVLSCTGLPRAIIDASGAELEKDLIEVSVTSTASSASLATGGGDNTNIYKLLLAPSNLEAPSITISGTGTAKTYTSTPTKEQILTAFEGTTNVSDDEIGAPQGILTKYGFTPLTSMSGTSTEALQTQLTLFNDKVKFTYCCYKTLYRKALEDFFDTPGDDTKRTRAIVLNLKLTIIVAGLYRIRRYFHDKSDTIMRDSNLKNNDIEDTTETLQSQLTTLTSKDSDKQLYARMVEYTEEKNQAHRNLLGMYTVLNLVALGLIFYIAKD
jgi:hypothetical protein